VQIWFGLRYSRWLSGAAWLNRRSSHKAFTSCVFAGDVLDFAKSRKASEDLYIRVAAEGQEMERSSKRGKIPQQDWPSIMARYEAGETLANIARTYDCSPPAISYIVSRSRARGAAPAPSAPISLEPQLIKSHPTELVPRQPQRGEALANVPLTSKSLQDPPRLEIEAGASRIEGEEPGRSVLNDSKDGDHGPSDHAAALTGYGEKRGKLHLRTPLVHDSRSEIGSQSPGGDSAERSLPLSAPVLQSFGPFAKQDANGAPLRLISAPQISNEGGLFIDGALRERVAADIAAFLTAFDVALSHDTFESRAGLREATDRLLRAGARTRIELERLEARVPLPPRIGGKPYEPAGGQR
jgi:hypothetical protein